MDTKTGGGAGVQVWTRGNMHWYMKRELRFGAEEGAVTVEWDDAAAEVLRVTTAAGAVEEHIFGWDVAASVAATVGVVDGARLLITPLSRTPMPPPMAAATVQFPAPVLEVAWLPPPPATTAPTAAAATSADAAAAATATAAATAAAASMAPPETALALLADGRLAVVSALRGSEWEETCEELLDEDDEEGNDVMLEGRVVEGSEELLKRVIGGRALQLSTRPLFSLT